MKYSVVFAGGGTGGHVYPALAIARALIKEDENVNVHFVGSRDGMENKIIPKEGFPLETIHVGRLNNVSAIQKIKTLLGLPFSIISSLLILRRIKPKWVMGVGGFASGPIMFAAWLMGIKVYFWEGNAFPGMANRLISRLASEGFFVFKDAVSRIKCKKVEVFGMPVRQSIEDLNLSNIQHSKPIKVLVFGGSLGAKAINSTVLNSVQLGGDWLQGVEIVHQTGRLDFQRVSGEYKKLHDKGMALNVQCFEFLHDMEQRYAWADIAVCRGGASTISELAACGKAALIVPFPFAADDHQRKNAEALVEAEAAYMSLQKDFTPEVFIQFIQKMTSQPEEISKLEKNIKNFHKPKAASNMAIYLVKQVRH